MAPRLSLAPGCSGTPLHSSLSRTSHVSVARIHPSSQSLTLIQVLRSSLPQRTALRGLHSDPRGSLRTGSERRGSELRMSASGTPMATEAQAMPEPVAVPVVNKDGDRLAGIILEPRTSGDAAPAPLAILCHGFRSSKRSSTLEGVATSLQKQGVASYRFDFAGNGESEGKFDVGNYKAEVEDLRSVVLFWKAQGRDPVAVLGHSKGGNVVLLYASKYSDVACVVNLSGRCRMDRGLRERYGEEGMRAIQEQGFLEVQEPSGSYRVTKEAIAERLSTDMVAAAAAIPSTCRVLTVHGSQDATVPVDDAETFSTLVQNHQLVVLEGGDHRFSKEYRTAMVDAVTSFIL